MRSSQTTFEQTLFAALEAQRGAVEHPPIDALVAYHANDLPGKEHEAVRDHLSHCDACADIVLDWNEFPTDEPTDPALRAQSGDEDEDWRAIEARLGLAEAVVVPFDPAVPKQPRRAAWLAVAATVSLAMMGLSFWIGGRQPDGVGPRANFHIAELIPEGAHTARGSGTAKRVSIPPGAEHLMLFLSGAPIDPIKSYRAELLRPDGEVLERWPDLHPAPRGSLTIEVPRRSISPGSYVLRIFDTTSPSDVPLVTYALRMERSPSE